MRKKSGLIKKWQRAFIIVYGLLFVLQMSSLGLAPVFTPEAGATTIIWDRSSLQFSATYLVDCEKISIQVCNYGDRDMAGTTNYDIWYKATGNPIDGAKVAGGTIPALSKGQCFSIEYSATAAGNYKFKAYQRPGHPGSGYTWSPIMSVGDLQCPEPVCGDGIINQTSEECDDGNTNDLDGCSNSCHLRSCELLITKAVDKANALPGDTLTYTISYENTGGQVCTGTGVKIYDTLDSYLTYAANSKTIIITNDGEGDGYLLTEGGDYNGHDNILLYNVNRVSPGESGVITLQATVGTYSSCGNYQIPNKAKIWSNQTSYVLSNQVITNINIPCAYCGDGIKNGTEQCDDGNQINTDGCLNNCTSPTCGDGYIWAGQETCDNNGLNGLPCVPSYGEQCGYCSGACELVELTGPYCGDGIKNGPEACDGADGVGAHQSCNQNCTLTDLPYCGNGIVDSGETCDDGNTNNNDQCKSDCTLPSICGNSLDIALVMDRSGSMGYSSQCDWWQLKCVNPPSCSSGYSWVKNTTYNQTQSWCNSKNQSAPHNSLWTEYNPVKITAAKTTANNFLNLMGLGDQSSLVSFANSATLDKQLSNNHAATQAAVNGLITNGATDIGDAISLATGELTSARINPPADQVMILLTDGMANKPYGPGYGEYAPDVAYALAKAGEAAAAGIKIFTIGLGNEINATMLQQIATLTGGQYYFAPTAQELQNIFAQITAEFCVQIGYNYNAAGDYGPLFAKIEPSFKEERNFNLSLRLRRELSRTGLTRNPGVSSRNTFLDCGSVAAMTSILNKNLLYGEKKLPHSFLC